MYICPGRPSSLTASGLRDTLMAASRMVTNKRQGTSRGATTEEDEESIMDPAEDDNVSGFCGQLEIWRLLPHLQGLPEAMLKKLPLNAVFQPQL